MRENFEGYKPPEEKANSEISKKEKPQSGALLENESPDTLIARLNLVIEKKFAIDVKGKENLQLIPPDRKVIFVPTHLTNWDVPIALSVMGKYFHVAVGDASTHHSIGENTPAYLGNLLVGQDNFYSVEHNKDSEGVERGNFNPDDFERMKEAFQENKALVISAYYTGKESQELPKRGEYGAVYLAEANNALIIPVAVDVKQEEQVGVFKKILDAFKKSVTEVTIGKPIELEEIRDIERISEIINIRKERKLTHEETQEFHRLRLALKEQSDRVMKKIAEMLPEEKRGRWQKVD